MPDITVEMAIIGAGSAGMSAYKTAKRALSATQRIVLIEQGLYGTMCARTGCMPSKLLIAAADIAENARRAPDFGIGVDATDLAIDGHAVLQRVRLLRDQFVQGVLDDINGMPACEKLTGRARFVDAHTLDVGGHTVVRARHIIIAAGSTPIIPEPLQHLPRYPNGPLLTSDDVFELPSLPSSMAVIGSGPIGLELGQALHRLGVDIDIIGRGNVLGVLQDPNVLAGASNIFSEELSLHLNTELIDAHLHVDGVTLGYRDHGQPHDPVRRASYTYVLAAAGRQPNVADLGLENTGLERDEKGIPLYDKDTMRCGASSIYLAGDVDAGLPLQHIATNEGRIAAWQAATGQSRQAPMPAALSIVFTDPQLVLVGKTHRQLSAEMGDGFVTGESDFSHQGRSIAMGHNYGLLHVYADRHSGRLLGAEMAVPDGEHLGHLLAWCCQLELTVGQMLELPFYHPTIEEGLKTALQRAQKQIKNRESPMQTL